MNAREVWSLAMVASLAVVTIGCRPDQPHHAASISSQRADPPATAPSYQSGEDARLRLRFQYPRDWVKEEDGDRTSKNGVFLSSPPAETGQRAVVAIDVLTIPGLEQMNLDGFAALAQERAHRKLNGFVLLSSLGDTSLGGKPARQWLYEHALDGNRVRVLHVFGVHAGVVYSVIFGAPPEHFDKWLPSAQAITRSIEFSW